MKVKVSVLVPPTSFLMLVKIISSRVPVFIPVIVHSLIALGPVTVSSPEPPVMLVISEKEVAPLAPVGFRVPVSDALIVHALTTLGPMIVLVPASPSIAPVI